MEVSDKNVTLEAMKTWVQAFCEERGWDPYHGPKDLAIGLVTESSELLEIFRFVDEEKCLALVEDPAQREAIADELADSLYFILRFAQLYKFDLSECVRSKIKKNAVKYPAPARP
jgi:NTP pyrophosphatase (non-canonical NTP hydrolase)